MTMYNYTHTNIHSQFWATSNFLQDTPCNQHHHFSVVNVFLKNMFNNYSLLYDEIHLFFFVGLAKFGNANYC